MKIAILGAGAMGCLVGALLQKGGEDVLLISRNATNMTAIQENGLELRLNGASETLAIATSITSVGHAPVDLIILLVKTPGTEAALSNASELIGKDTYVLTLQNGLGNTERISKFVSEDRVLHGILKMSGQMIQPGVITSSTVTGVPSIYLGSVTKNDKAEAVADQIAATFCKSGIIAVCPQNLEQEIWEKAANNCGVTTCCGISRTQMKYFVLHKAGYAILEQCVQEIVKVAAAKGILLDKDTILDGIVNQTVPKMGDHLPSVAQDVKRHSQTEIESLNGQISRYGSQLGIPTPVNDTIANFLRVIGDNYENQF